LLDASATKRQFCVEVLVPQLEDTARLLQLAVSKKFLKQEKIYEEIFARINFRELVCDCEKRENFRLYTVNG